MILGALNRELQALAREGFQQIIHRVHLKRAKRVAVVRRCEDYPRLLISVFRASSYDIEAVHVRHLDVQEDKIRLCKLNQIDGLQRGCTFPDDLNFHLIEQKLPELLPS